MPNGDFVCVREYICDKILGIMCGTQFYYWVVYLYSIINWKLISVPDKQKINEIILQGPIVKDNIQS